MKTYTFSFNNKKSNSREIPTSTNYSALIDAAISSNVKKYNPWLFGEEKTHEPIIIERPKNRTIDIDITIPMHKTAATTSYSDLTKAIEIINKYKPTMAKDDYDFKLADGTPVKLFSDEIQIGFDLIPLNSMTKALYDSLSEQAKKNIIDITLIIKKK